MEKKEKKRGSTKKTPKISKKLSPRASNTVNGPCNHKDLYLWHRGSIIHYAENQIKIPQRLRGNTCMRATAAIIIVDYSGNI